MHTHTNKCERTNLLINYKENQVDLEKKRNRKEMKMKNHKNKKNKEKKNNRNTRMRRMMKRGRRITN